MVQLVRMTDDFVSVLYATSYGGFLFPAKFREFFAERNGGTDLLALCNAVVQDSPWPHYVNCTMEVRSSCYINTLWEEYRKKNACHDIGVVLVHKELMPFLVISECDGCETLHVDEGQAYKRLLEKHLLTEATQAEMAADVRYLKRLLAARPPVVR